MALAPFFDKTLLALRHILPSLNAAGAQDLLQDKCVEIAFDDAAVVSPEGRWIAELSVNLAARLYPRIALSPVGEQADAFGRKLGALASSINPKIEFAVQEEADALISVGQQTWESYAKPCVYVGAVGWQAHISHRAPCALSGDGNPFGAGAAACLAAAQIFRILFAEQLGTGLPEEVSLSVWDYEVNGDASTAQTTTCDCDGVLLCGAGAIGNAVLWALTRSGATGVMTVVDPECVEESNLQRYLLTDIGSVGQSKVELARAQAAGLTLTILPVQESWGSFVTGRHPLRTKLVATALDTAQARIEVQAALPERIVNAWTQAGDLGVSRHAFLGDQACLSCLYLAHRAAKSEDQIIAEALGLDATPNSGSLMLVRNALYANAVVDESWIERIGEGLGVESDALTPFLGKPLKTLYREGICGGSVLTTRMGSIEVPMAFQSAMAGILLAAEIVKNRRGHLASTVTTKLNLLRPLGMFLSESQEKCRFGNCICQDPDFIGAYQAKF